MKNNLINGMKPEFGNLEQIKILQAEQQERQAKADRENTTPEEKHFQAFIEVDFAMGWIQQASKQLGKQFNGRSPIDIMFDTSTGYDKAVIKGFILELKGAYEHMIECFKIMSDIEREKQYKELLFKINAALKGEYKKVKAFEFKLK